MSKVLVVVAHPDDEVLGMGGTIAKYVDEGQDIYGHFLGDGVSSRYKSPSKAPQEEIEKRKNWTDFIVEEDLPYLRENY